MAALRETFRDPRVVDGRAASTAILFLLKAGERSRSAPGRCGRDLGHFHAGAPLALSVEGQGVIVLGPDLAAGQTPQGVVPTGAWQAAQSRGEWTLVGCTVAPGFDFAGFELAAPGWVPEGWGDGR